jgi:hypothetical protein
MLNLHNCSLLDKEEVFPLGPSVFGRVAVDLSPLQKLLIFLVELLGKRDLLGRLLAFVQEEIVVLVLVIDLFLEEILNFLEIS